jgi:hypothetical protein
MIPRPEHFVSVDSPWQHCVMASGDPMWRTILEAARSLDSDKGRSFSRAEIIHLARKLDASHHEMAYSAMFQTMVIEAPTPAASPVGKVFRRLERGHYCLSYGGGAPHPARATRLDAAPPLRWEPGARPRRTDVAGRVDKLISGFDDYVARYDAEVPFRRFGQLEYHRDTIDRRRTLGTVSAALRDDEFLSLLYKTLRAWGIGLRASNLVPREDFGGILRQHEAVFIALEPLVIEDLDLDVPAVTTMLWRLIDGLGIVDNRAKIVPGTKTIHHLLPDLMPPLDRRWSGLFFGWTVADPQWAQERIFAEAFGELARVARTARPSRLVGDGWRTSSTKILDNALIADSEPFRTPVPIESVHRFRRFRTPAEETLLAAGAR